MVYCLYSEEELKGAKTRPPEGCIMVEAVIHKFGFHPDRVQEKAKDIEVLLRQLPEEFYATKGGGCPFSGPVFVLMVSSGANTQRWRC